MKTVLKFPLQFRQSPCCILRMPKGATILSCQVQHGDITLWALADLDAPLEDRRFLIVATGQALPGDAENAVFLGTVQWGVKLVFHIFEGPWVAGAAA